MKTPIEKTDSLKKVLQGSKTFDEAEYYRNSKAEIGGEVAPSEEEPEEEDDPDEEEEFYGDED